MVAPRCDSARDSAVSRKKKITVPVVPSPTVSEVSSPKQPPVFVKPSLSDLRSCKVELPPDPPLPVYTPYTVEDYQQLPDVDRGGLGPSRDEEWQRARDARQAQMEFAQRAAAEVRARTKKKGPEPAAAPKAPSKHDRMVQYGAKIPKPRARSETSASRTELKGEPAPIPSDYDWRMELAVHDGFVRRIAEIESVLAEFEDGDAET